jgi:UTP--glucose-1-phosphate uridylyltransferase
MFRVHFQRSGSIFSAGEAAREEGRLSGVKKAVVTAAGRGTRHFPATRTVQKELFPLVDRDGVTKPVLQIVAEEALESGIERVCIVCSPDSIGPVRAHFAPVPDGLRRSLASRPELLAQADRLDRIAHALEFAVQPTPEGYGDAVLRSRDFAGGEPFLLLLGDHVYASETDERCARHLLRTYDRVRGPVSGVTRTPMDRLRLFGAIAGDPVEDSPALYRVREMIEKPSPEVARQRLVTPGLPPDTALSFFGMHILTPEVFDLLADRKARDRREDGEIQLTGSLEELMRRRDYFAVEMTGERLDMGVPDGLVHTQQVMGRWVVG